MKKFILISCIAIFISSVFLSTSFAMSFSDLPSTHWAYDNIMRLAEDGIIDGYENGTYKPEKAVTRGEFLKLIMTSLYGGNEYFEKNNFNFGHWSMPYAIEAANLGYLMDGTTILNLDNQISRKEMVHILAKVCIDNKIQKDELGSIIEFLDTENLDADTKVYINFVTENGLINGYTDGKFKADKTMTRAEVATVINRFLNLKD